MSPTTGWADVTTAVTITGTGFQSGAQVLLNGGPAQSWFINSTVLAVGMPPREIGPVEIAVRNPDGVTVIATQPFTYIETPLVVFTEPDSGFSTPDVRDAQGQIVRFDRSNQLIWTPDGTKLAGFAWNGSVIDAERACSCQFEVRFGTEGGDRRAYLTADWGHDNPGTIVDLEIAGGQLTVTRGTGYPPGSFTLSGVVAEETDDGIAPAAGAWVRLIVGFGWRESYTDVEGRYEIPGLYPSSPVVEAIKAGYVPSQQEVSIAGNTRYDIRLRRPATAEVR
jgi:hypothetical protein